MKMYFVRHGETERGANGVYGYSAPLTELGREQASRAGERLSKLGVTEVVSSDATRAIQSAEPLAATLNVATTVIPELTEIDIGISSDGVTPIYENRTPDGRYIMDCAHLGGEAWETFRDRVISGLGMLSDRFADDDVIAVFTHGGVKSVAFDHFSGRDISRTMRTLYDNGAISTVESDGTVYQVHTVNDVSHLS